MFLSHHIIIMTDDDYFIWLCDSQEYGELFILRNRVFIPSKSALNYGFELSIFHENVDIMKLILTHTSWKLHQTVIDKLYLEATMSNFYEGLFILQDYVSPQTCAEQHRLVSNRRRDSSAKDDSHYIISVTEPVKILEITKRMETSLVHMRKSFKIRLQEQFWINNEFTEAARNGFKLLISRITKVILCGRFALVPDQSTINDAFLGEVKKCSYSMASLLAVLITNDTYDDAFKQTIEEGDIKKLKWMLSGRVGGRYPSQALIDHSYETLMRQRSPLIYTIGANTSPEVVIRMEAIEEERRQQAARPQSMDGDRRRRRHLGSGTRSVDIHAYARSAIAVDNGLAARNTQRRSLNEQIMSSIERRVGGEGFNFQQISENLSRILNLVFPHNDEGTDHPHSNQVMNILSSGLNTETARHLGLTLKFLQMFPVESSVIWMQGFLGEAVSVHSCVQGAMERMITGLRGIGDPELDNIFSVVEGPNLARIFLSQYFNIYYDEHTESSMKERKKRNTLDIAKDLHLRGVLDIISEQNMTDLLTCYVEESVSPYNVDVKILRSDIKSVVETLQDLYEEFLLPTINALARNPDLFNSNESKNDDDMES